MRGQRVGKDNKEINKKCSLLLTKLAMKPYSCVYNYRLHLKKGVGEREYIIGTGAD